jgi:MurNAc alpha-1-phosphate uridylyltransferase
MRLSHAIILAAGLGTRMRPLTNSMPKPLIPVKGKPLIDWCLDWLAEAEINTVVINTSYLADMLEAHVSSRSGRIRLSREEPEPLETGGGITKALPMLGEEPFLAMNSDAIFPSSLPHPIMRMVDGWREDIDFLMLLVPKAKAVGWEGKGDFIMDDEGRIRRPRDGEEAPYVFTGVEIIHPRAFAGCPAGKFSLSLLWNAHRDTQGWFTRIRAIVHDDAWLNVGDLAGLAEAEAYSGSLSIGSRM